MPCADQISSCTGLFLEQLQPAHPQLHASGMPHPTQLLPGVHVQPLLSSPLAMQTAMVRDIMVEHLVAGADSLLEAAPASTTAAKQQLLGLLNGILYTIIGLGSTLAGDWPQDPGRWAVIGQVSSFGAV